MAYDHNATKTLADELKEAIIEILQGHIGADNAIKAQQIAKQLNRTGRYADRPIREAIRGLRKDGWLILSSVKKPAGYFLAETEEEWIAFRDRNLRPRALDILQTARAMGDAAGIRWGEATQLELPVVRSTRVIQIPMSKLVA